MCVVCCVLLYYACVDTGVPFFFLSYINDLLASGRIPDLYDQEGKDEICNMVTSRVKEDGLVPDAPVRRRKEGRRCLLCFYAVLCVVYCVLCVLCVLWCVRCDACYVYDDDAWRAYRVCC